jgi:hypothetical protein
MVFWPNSTDGTITVVNAGRSRQGRAAIGKVRIYEIEGGLPALEFDPLPGDRFIGPYLERIDRTIPRIFYTGPLEAQFPYALLDGYFNGYYAAWYQTIANFIRYLRFTGQNTCFAGIYMYHAGWFPSQRFQGMNSDGADYHGEGWPAGVVELMARMFEANDLNLVLGIQFFGSPTLLRGDSVSDREVKQGKPSLRLVTANGIQARGYGTFNFLLPEVRREMIGLAREIADRYRSYPGIKGITWMRSPRFAPSNNDPQAKDGTQVGYGDQTMALFQKESGVSMPSFAGAHRFQQRYQWLKAHAWQAWLDWRADKVFQMDGEIAEIFSEARSDWKLWRLADPVSSEYALSAWQQGAISYLDTYRYEGLDPHKYDAEANPKLIPVINWTGDRLYRDKLGRVTYSELIRDFNWSGEHAKYFAKVGLFLRVGFMIERHLVSEQNWPWRRMRVVGNSAPAGEAFSREAKQLFEGFDPEIAVIGWNDGGYTMGHEQEIREIVRHLDRAAP